MPRYGRTLKHYFKYSIWLLDCQGTNHIETAVPNMIEMVPRSGIEPHSTLATVLQTVDPTIDLVTGDS